jgi:hypothetical protein
MYVTSLGRSYSVLTPTSLRARTAVFVPTALAAA